ncbi:MAG: hypothetical protein JKX76_03265 [Colwellia sp.]|nr:hypothetical protein [Colwellia sp.]
MMSSDRSYAGGGAVDVSKWNERLLLALGKHRDNPLLLGYPWFVGGAANDPKTDGSHFW